MSNPFRITPEPVKQAWMITFTDLVTLLLTFFVMIYSMTSIPSRPFDAPGKKGDENPDTNFANAGPDESNYTDTPQGLGLDYIYNVIKEQVEKKPDLGITPHITDRGLVLSLGSDILFSPGQALVLQQASPTLMAVAGMISNIPNRIVIEGHTDPRAVKTVEFTDNTELALARAAAVGEFLQHAGFTDDLRIYARSDGDFGEISADLPQDERYKRARRVDVVILPEHR